VEPPAAATPTALWARIVFPTQTFSVTDEALWVAEPGERYLVLVQQEDWLLVMWEGDTLGWAVWIPASAVQLETMATGVPAATGRLGRGELAL